MLPVHTHDDHQLLHDLPTPHGPVFAWLERQLADHGALTWAQLEQALVNADPPAPPEARVPQTAHEVELGFADLRRVLDGLWIEQLRVRQTDLIARAATDVSALQEWREINQRREALLKAVQAPLGEAPPVSAR